MPSMNFVCDAVNLPTSVNMVGGGRRCQFPAEIDKKEHLTDVVLFLLPPIIHVISPNIPNYRYK